MRRRLVTAGVPLAVLIVLPFALSEYRTVQLATVGALLIGILGLDILSGSSGQISLGHGAFMGIGAYTTAILVAHHGVQDVWTIPVAAGVAGAIGSLAGIPALRLRGRSLTLATLGLALALPSLLEKFNHFTGGPTGISFFGNPRETGRGTGVEVLGLHLTNGVWVYTLTWALAIALFAAARWLLASRFGRSLRALRDSEPAATSAGVNRSAYGIAALGISASYAGVAGSLLAIINAYVSPSSFAVQLSLYLVVGSVVGLFGSIRGAVLGALAIQFLPDLVGVLPQVDTKVGGASTFAFGAVLVASMLLLPVIRRVAARAGYSLPG